MLPPNPASSRIVGLPEPTHFRNRLRPPPMSTGLPSPTTPGPVPRVALSTSLGFEAFPPQATRAAEASTGATTRRTTLRFFTSDGCGASPARTELLGGPRRAVIRGLADRQHLVEVVRELEALDVVRVDLAALEHGAA